MCGCECVHGYECVCVCVHSSTDPSSHTHLILDSLVSTVNCSSEHRLLTRGWLGLCLETNLEGEDKGGGGRSRTLSCMCVCRRNNVADLAWAFFILGNFKF